MSTTTIDQGVKVFEAIADGPTKARARKIVELGQGVWVVDPFVPGVVALVVPAENSNTAWLVVYVDDQDFETSRAFDELWGE